MITNETRIIDLTVSQFRQLIRDENSILNLPEKQIIPPKILKRKDVAQIFGISLVSLTEWVKSGKLICHRIGSRVYFFENEVYDALNKREKGRSSK